MVKKGFQPGNEFRKPGAAWRWQIFDYRLIVVPLAHSKHGMPRTPLLKHSESSHPISNNLRTFTPESPKSPLYPLSGISLLACPSERSSDPGATMTTVRQIEANRRNAQNSTGPTSVTEIGRA